MEQERRERRRRRERRKRKRRERKRRKRRRRRKWRRKLPAHMLDTSIKNRLLKTLLFLCNFLKQNRRVITTFA